MLTLNKSIGWTEVYHEQLARPSVQSPAAPAPARPCSRCGWRPGRHRTWREMDDDALVRVGQVSAGSTATRNSPAACRADRSRRCRATAPRRRRPDWELPARRRKRARHNKPMASGWYRLRWSMHTAALSIGTDQQNTLAFAIAASSARATRYLTSPCTTRSDDIAVGTALQQLPTGPAAVRPRRETRRRTWLACVARSCATLPSRSRWRACPPPVRGGASLSYPAVIPAGRRRGHLRAAPPAARPDGDAARDGRPGRWPWRRR